MVLDSVHVSPQQNGVVAITSEPITWEAPVGEAEAPPVVGSPVRSFLGRGSMHGHTSTGPVPHKVFVPTNAAVRHQRASALASHRPAHRMRVLPPPWRSRPRT